MNSRDHFLHAIMYAGFSIISGITSPILAALAEPTGCIIAAVMATVCGSRMLREIEKGRTARRIENISQPFPRERTRGECHRRRVAGNPLSYIQR